MILGFIPMLIAFIVPKSWLLDSKLFYTWAYYFYALLIKVSFLPITYEGKENIPEGPVIFAANHQSSLDIPLVGILARGTPHVWLALSSLMKSPILRFVLPRVAVLVDMSTPVKGMRSLLQIVSLVTNKHRSVMIFPEGGRYTDGKVHDFYGGFVILAKKTGRPVVPVRIFGVNKVYPPKCFLVYSHPVRVVIGKPFTFHEGESDEEFKNRVYKWFVEQA
jgi:1-acyl-sn-glycerol-3-phosphate acyltransferase